MADPTVPGDETDVSVPSYATTDELRGIAAQVASQNQRMEEMMTYFRSHLPAAPSPSTSAAPVETTAQGAPTVTLPAPPVTEQVQAAVPPAQGAKSTPEAKQSKAFQRRKPLDFYGGTDLVKAEKFLMNHEKIHDIVATPEHMRATISSGSLFGEADVWWRSLVSTRGRPQTWLDFKKQFNLKYFPTAVLRDRRTEFMNIRQAPGESVLDYMGRYLQLLQYASGVADTDDDQVFYFVEGLLPGLGGFVTTTEPETLQRAYERSLARERYLRAHPVAEGTIEAQPVTQQYPQSDYRSGPKRKKGKFRGREFRAQSVASAVTPTPAGSASLALPAPTQSAPIVARPPPQPQRVGGRGGQAQGAGRG